MPEKNNNNIVLFKTKKKDTPPIEIIIFLETTRVYCTEFTMANQEDYEYEDEVNDSPF